jgi:hypothetical protein
MEYESRRGSHNILSILMIMASPTSGQEGNKDPHRVGHGQQPKQEEEAAQGGSALGHDCSILDNEDDSARYKDRSQNTHHIDHNCKNSHHQQ